MKENAKMKLRSVFVSLLSAATSSVALAQAPPSKTRYQDEVPPPVAQVLARSQAGAALPASLISAAPQAPLGPDSILQGYENQMTLVSQKMSVEIQTIERALESGQINHDQAEFLIQQRYQIAMMQYEVFTALHDALEQEILQAAPPSRDYPAEAPAATVRARLAVSSTRGPGQ
jgi:hypothetical protein